MVPLQCGRGECEGGRVSEKRRQYPVRVGIGDKLEYPSKWEGFTAALHSSKYLLSPRNFADDAPINYARPRLQPRARHHRQLHLRVRGLGDGDGTRERVT